MGRTDSQAASTQVESTASAESEEAAVKALMATVLMASRVVAMAESRRQCMGCSDAEVGVPGNVYQVCCQREVVCGSRVLAVSIGVGR